MIERYDYSPIAGSGAGFRVLVAALIAAVGAGLWAAHHMDTAGHVVTGMSNRIVWGAPHVFAVFLIVAASGALNAASMSSVFGRHRYAPMARLSCLLAGGLLLGGLAILVLDLGRPERIGVALTHFNFSSIFAWNVFLYTGFLVILVAYAAVIMTRGLSGARTTVGTLALVWRVALTTGTGSIFGFIVARPGYDAAIMAPLFVAMSLSLGTAVFALVLLAACGATGRAIGDDVLAALGRLLGLFVALVLYLVVVFHLTNLYVAEHAGIERFVLADGGAITAAFWIGQIGLGSLAPLALAWFPRRTPSRARLAIVAALVVLGGFAQLYVIVIGGQAWPLEMFPGKEIVESAFFDATIASYRPRIFELVLGVGGIGLALLVVTLGLRVLPMLPDSIGEAPERGA